MTATTTPMTSIAASTGKPNPINGGIDSSPVASDTIPVAVSARTKGSEVIANAFTTAVLSFPSFHGLFFDDQIPSP
jgi:hypothetical protein